MKRKISLYGALVLVVMIVAFMAQNSEILQLNFLFWSFTARRSFILMLFLLAGVVLSLLIQMFIRWKWGRPVGGKTPKSRVESEPGAKPATKDPEQ